MRGGGGMQACMQSTRGPCLMHGEHLINSSYYCYHHYCYWLGEMKLDQVMGQQNSGFKNITEGVPCWPSGWDSGLSLLWPGFIPWLGN